MSEERRMMLKQMTTSELYANAYSKLNEEYFDLIHELRTRSAPEDFQYCIIKSSDIDPIIRKIAIDTLEQIGFDRTLTESELSSIEYSVMSCIETANELLLESVIRASGRRGIHASIPFLVKYSNSKNALIREAVAFSLSNFETEESINSLIQLCDDQSDAVRNMATFALGSQINKSNETIIDALLSRVHDSNLEIAGEAVLGLAVRNFHDTERIINEKLQSDEINVLIFEASDIYPCKSFASRLIFWKNQMTDADGLMKDFAESALMKSSNLK